MEFTQRTARILDARYPGMANADVAELFTENGKERQTIDALLDAIAERLDNPEDWPGYVLHEKVTSLTDRHRELAKECVEAFRISPHITADDIHQFFAENQYHCMLKYAMRRWLLLNPGVAIELFDINAEILDQKVLEKIRQFGIQEGDQLIHLHVVSNRERGYLKNMGFEIPHGHWHQSYYADALRVINSLLQSNPSATGFFCEYSWVFAPNIHEEASDGRPFAACSFLQDDRMTGFRFYVGEAAPDNEYASQFRLATRNERRQQLYEAGEFQPEVWGFFYPKELLHVNLHWEGEKQQSIS